MASSPPTDLELVTFNYIRTNYEKKHKQTVPMALKYLTLKFSNRIIGGKLLTIKEDMDFFKLLQTKLPSTRRFKFLFRASDHQYSAQKFHQFCNNKPGTITIIKSNWGNVFGGYASKSWTSENEWISDQDAFLFLIKSKDELVQKKCPLLLKLKKQDVEYAIRCASSYGPVFGTGFDIRIMDDCNKKLSEASRYWDANYSCQSSYDTPKVNICGGNDKDSNGYLFQVIDYEVFRTI